MSKQPLKSTKGKKQRNVKIIPLVEIDVASRIPSSREYPGANVALKNFDKLKTGVWSGISNPWKQPRADAALKTFGMLKILSSARCQITFVSLLFWAQKKRRYEPPLCLFSTNFPSLNPADHKDRP